MLPIQGPPDPKDDHHEDELISEAAERIFRQRECIHDWQELNETFCHCRICDKVERWSNQPPDNKFVMMKAEGMTFMVPMSCLPEQFQSTIKRLRKMRQEKQSESQI